MKCKKCRKTIPDGSKFCNHCGEKQTGRQTLYRRPDGLYEKTLTIDGKRVRFRGKDEATVFEKIRNYNTRKETGPKFSEIADNWHTEHWVTLSPTTQRGYKCAYDEITEYFGNDYIKQISHRDINRYIKQLPSTYARKTCVTRLQLLNQIFKFAITDDIIETNPCEYISVPKGHSAKKRRAPTDEEIKKIKSSVGILYNGFDIGLLAVFLLYTGCRKGEALALQFRDINRDTARVSITKSVYFVNNDGKIKRPKTEAGEREVIIPNYLLPLLPKGKSSEYVFSEFKDKPMRQHFFDKAWSKWRKDTGLNLTAHQLRHGYATLLHEADIDVKDAQDLLGHADASTTQNIYTEVSKRRRTATAEKLNNYLQ